MEMLEKLPPEVLIYVQNVRKYFSTNEDTKEYFNLNTYGEKFFKELIELSQKNFDETGEAELTMEQFEELKRKVTSEFAMYGVFMSLGGFGLISLN